MDDSSCIPQKQCIYCKNHFPATHDFFFANKKSKDFLSWRCKTCFYIRNPKPVEGYKHCPGCNKDLPKTTEYFHSNRRNKDGLHSKCKACRKEKPWRPQTEQSRKNINKRQQAYRLKRIEIARGYQRRYGASSLGRANRKKHHEEIRARQRRYYQSEHGQEIFKVARRNRRARKRNAQGSHTAKEIREQYDRQKGHCYYCKDKIAWKKHHVEHVIPLARGGSNDISNIVIACPTCNLRKSNKLPHEWPEGGRLL